MTDEIDDLKRKVAELEARQQVTQATSKPNTGDLAVIMRLIVLILVAMVGIAALANVSGVSLTGKKTTGVSTAADVVAYQKKSLEAKPVVKPVVIDTPERVAWRKKVMTSFTDLGVIYKLKGRELHVQPDLFKGMPHDAKVGLAMAAQETAGTEFVDIVDSTTNKVIAKYNPRYGLSTGGGISNWAR